MIPLPRPWLLAGALLVGAAVGLLAGVGVSALHARLGPEMAIGLVVGVPSVLGLLIILFSGRRWLTTLGAFVLALGPGWFGVLVALRVSGG